MIFYFHETSDDEGDYNRIEDGGERSMQILARLSAIARRHRNAILPRKRAVCHHNGFVLNVYFRRFFLNDNSLLRRHSGGSSSVGRH